MAKHSLALALLGMAAATCQGAIRWYTNDYEGALEAARKAGKPMVIVFHASGDRLRAPRKLFESDMLAAYHRQFVFCYNDVEVKNGSMSHGLFHKYNPGDGAHSLPIIFFADTDEKVLGKMENPSRVGEIAAEMAAVLKKLGGPASAKKARAAQEAREELAKRRVPPEAKEALEKAEKKEPVAARVAPRRTDDPSDIEGDFFTDEELDALDRMAGGDEAKADEKGAAAAAECRRLLSFARGWIANKQHDKAREALEKIIAKHPDTLFADQAKALLEQLK